MSPAITDLFLNSQQMQSFLGPLSNLPLQLKLPVKLRSTALPPTHMLSFDPNLSGSNDQPIAILHPNQVSQSSNLYLANNNNIIFDQVLTLTTTGLLRNKFNEHFVTPNGKPLRLVIDGQSSPKRKRMSTKRNQRSTLFKNNWFPQKLRQKRRSFKEFFSFRNWFKSRFH